MTTTTSTTPTDWPAVCAIATRDEDAALVNRDDALDLAQYLADEFGQPTTIRDPITDHLLMTVEPGMIDAETREDLATYYAMMRGD